jgi:hypothetical protein
MKLTIDLADDSFDGSWSFAVYVEDGGDEAGDGLILGSEGFPDARAALSACVDRLGESGWLDE